ncbi:MAG: type I-B CRISPR-associated endonuclease Cas1b [Candidatus Bathyarchaeia archaeon]
MKRTIYIFSNGELKRKGNTLLFEREDGSKKYLPIENTKEFMVFGEVAVNKKLLDFLSQNEVIIHFFNYYGYYSGSFYPREHYNSGYMILKQAEHYLDQEKRLDLAKAFVEGAVANIEKVLGYYFSRGADLEAPLSSIKVIKGGLNGARSNEELMAIEGNIRDIYYRSFDEILKSDEFSFGSRTKRPPLNRLNALISFGNSLLYTIVLSEIYKTHLDPRIGYLHATNFRRFTLNLDVAEVFKPIIVDRLIFSLLNKEMIKKKHFDEKLKGVYLNEKGRAIFVEELDKKLKSTIKHPSIGKNVSYRRLIRLELYKIEKHLIGEKNYVPFIARW